MFQFGRVVCLVLINQSKFRLPLVFNLCVHLGPPSSVECYSKECPVCKFSPQPACLVSCLWGSPLKSTPQDKSFHSDDGNFKLTLYLSAGLGTPLGPPGRAGGSGWGQGRLGFSVKTAAPTTRPPDKR